MPIAPDDSLLFFLGKEFVVTATRLPMTAAAAPAAVERFDAEDLAALPGRSIADALEGAAGAQLRSYGNGLRMLSFRGLGPEYTVVYYNGVRLNDAQNGTVDLGRVALTGVNRLEVARGGFATLYGADALGGVVSISSGITSPPLLSVSAGAGSFGWSSAEIASGFGAGPLRISVAGVSEQARNNYRFNMDRGPAGEHERSNADYRRRLLLADAEYSAPAARIGLHARLADSDAGVPGAFLSAAPGIARQHDIDAAFSLQGVLDLGGGTVLRVAPALSFNRQHYTDASVQFGGEGVDSRYNNTAVSLSASLRLDADPRLRGIAGVDFTHASLRSDDVKDRPARTGIAVFVSGEAAVSGFDALRLFPSLRCDAVLDEPGSKSLVSWSPGMGANLAIDGERLFLRARASRGFRVPTFNQRYWLQGGNPDLRPEYSSSYEAGVGAAPAGAAMNAELNLFYHDIADKIVWMPGGGLFWSPRNVQHVVSRGVELSFSGSLHNALSYRANAQWLSAKKMNSSFTNDATAGKQLPYTPAFSGTATIDAKLGAGIGLCATVHVLGERFSMETNAPESRLDAHATLDAAVTYVFRSSTVQWTMKAETLNMLDASYEVIAYYPMPLRSFRFTLSTTINSTDTQ